jgi:phytoene dehydrogenase-like protein
MSERYHAIIIGAGHNGLVAAAYLAQSGQQVLILERREVLGGAAATEEVFPGFMVNTGAHDAGLFQEEIVKALFLKMQGLEFRESPVIAFAPQTDGPSLTLWRDAEKSTDEIARFSQQDAKRFPSYVRQVGRMSRVLQQTMLLPPPDVMDRNITDLLPWGKVGLRLKGLGNREMMEFLRVLPMPAAEYLDEWFETDALKGALGASSVSGMMQGPRSVGTALMMMYQAADGNGGFRASRFVRGGMGELSATLASAARQNGAEIRTGIGVARILLQNGRATGVLLANGEEILADLILSSVDPRRTFFQLVGAPNLEPRFVRAVRNIIYRGSTAKMNLALSGLPQFIGQTDEKQLSGHILISPSLEYLERAYDDAKYGRTSSNPFLDIVIPSMLDGTMAPAGQHLMSIIMRYAPYNLRDSDWEEEREALGDQIVTTLAKYAPNINDLILHRQVLTPLDWEQSYGLTEGSVFQGQMGLDQLLIMRPLPKWSQYRTPIANLYLCGACAHPGGGITGAPGYNAAREVLKDERWAT